MTKDIILTEIADYEALIADASVPAEEKDFARSEIAQLNAQLAVLEGEGTEEAVTVLTPVTDVPAKKGKGRPAGSKNKKVKVKVEKKEKVKEDTGKKNTPEVSDTSAYEEIAELKELIESGALPAEEKEFAEQRISELYANISAEEMATSVPVTPKHRKAGIKHATKSPKKVYEGKKRGRKVGYRKPKQE